MKNEKKVTTINIDSKVLSRAKREIPNISVFIENCLKVYLNITDNDDNVSLMQDELNKIKDARLKLHLLSEVQDNDEEIQLYDKDKINRAWSSIWREYRTHNYINNTNMQSACNILNRTENELKDIMDTLLYNTDSQELILCDEWDYALNKYKQLE